ncbi:MAG TPA: hypothetical protein VKQ30_04710 [Ktedonobacterales bacterium]|nr:hypothetical protein [Ktedonobacterales bacterium]
MEKLLPRPEQVRVRPPRAAASRSQQPFTVVAPVLRSALLLGAAGGFVLASVLSLSLAFRVSLGPWWSALAQAHGHLQVYGWAGLFVLGVALHFLPRLRGAPLAWPRAIPWLLSALVTALVLRGLSQPLLAIVGAESGWAWLWRLLLVASGVLELLAIGSVLVLLAGTALRRDGPALRARPALWSVWPFLLCAVSSLVLAAIINLMNVVAASYGGAALVPAAGDGANVLLGLFGFLVPMALAMSARALPMYAGLEAFPRRVLWPAALTYCAGLVLALLGTANNLAPGTALGRIGGLGVATMGGVLVVFIGFFVRLMAGRGQLPQRVRSLAPAPEQAARTYRKHVSSERATFGPYVPLIGSAYSWALVAGLLMLLDGVALALGAGMPVTLDAPRHSLAVGFIALLLAGVSTRMIPGFSGGRLASPRWVVALLWLGNGAALLRVGSLLALPMLAGGLGAAGITLDSALFGLSGPLGLAFAVCLVINLWPALSPRSPVTT